MLLPSSWPSQQHAAYAGIGSRRTPPDILDLMRRVGAVLAASDWVLRTGLAGGADQAFYRGASAHGALELYLPWPAFEEKARVSGGAEQFVLSQPTEAAHELTARFHPAWSRLSRRRAFAARAKRSSGARPRPGEPGALRVVLDPGWQSRRAGPQGRRDRPGATHRARARHPGLQPRPARARRARPTLLRRWLSGVRHADDRSCRCRSAGPCSPVAGAPLPIVARCACGLVGIGSRNGWEPFVKRRA
jgi:hypothetical protein